MAGAKHPARADGIERLETFLQSELAQNDFSQEAKVIRQVLHSDMSIYVIDAREPVLNKYRDELTLLSWCARPLMPVFNFIGGQTSRSGRNARPPRPARPRWL